MKLKKYSKYKDSGIDWIWEIPEEWEIRRWRFDLGMQMWFPAESKLFDNTQWFPLIRIRDLQKSKIETYYKWSFPKNSLVKKWDHLVWMDWNFHSVLWDNENAILNQRIMKINVWEKLNEKYFYYMLSDPLKVINDITYATTVKHLSDWDIKEISFSIPPLKTQKNISSFLDTKTLQIENLIKKDKKLIELLKEKRVSLINKAVTKGMDWELNKFKHLFNFSKWLSITKENLEDEWIPCVNYWEIHSKYGFELNPEINLLKCVSEDYLKISRKSLLKKGDFVFADTSEDLEWSWNFTYLNSNIQTFAGYHTVIARHTWNISHRFLAYFCDSELFRSQIRKVVKWVKVYSITNDILKNTIVWYPMREDQDKIVDILDKETIKIDSHIIKVKKRIESYKEYKKSLIYNVVTGKVEV